MLRDYKKTLEAIFYDAIKNYIDHSNNDKTDLSKNFSITFERPKVSSHGDLASNIAMQMAKALQVNPRQLAETLALTIRAHPQSKNLISTVDIAGPGFINLKLCAEIQQAVIKNILIEGATFGQSNTHTKQHILIEFVSANPTGPLHVGHGRQAVIGDSLANLLSTQGYKAWREFYYNDAGVQIQTLALSVQARARGFKPGDKEWPEAAYNGEYILDIAGDFLAKVPIVGKENTYIEAKGNIEDLESIRRYAVAYLRNEQDSDLEAIGVKFDHYFLESSLYTEGHVENTVDALKSSGHTYESEGALWLRTTDWNDDKDRVMRKTDHTYTYFVPDVAYHLNKWMRGFKQVINIQGTDHHGTMARVKAGLQALNKGIPADYPHYVLHKMVTVMRGGQEVKLSKRAGSYVTMRDLIEWSGGATSSSNDEKQKVEIENVDTNTKQKVTDKLVLQRGRDAVRFFLISRKADTEFVFDIDLALKQNDENPVYYVQYAHARICSVLSAWGGESNTLIDADVSSLTSEQAQTLLRRLADYPEVLTRAAEELAPHAIAFYLRDLAANFHTFYNAERVLVENNNIKHARLALLAATKQVLQNGLALLGVSSPAKM